VPDLHTDIELPNLLQKMWVAVVPTLLHSKHHLLLYIILLGRLLMAWEEVANNPFEEWDILLDELG
jgi:hypothetical protein